MTGSFSQIEALQKIIQSNPTLTYVMDAVPKLNLPDYYIGAGCIVQTVWNELCGMPRNYGIDDIDLVYFDPDLSQDKELETIARATELLAELPIRIDVKNQARVHLWYEQRFGYAIPPYRTVEAAIDTWPTTATALGVRRTGDDWTIYAPFGLDDLFGMIVRANKAQITKEIYEKKAARWSKHWPSLRVVPWEMG